MNKGGLLLCLKYAISPNFFGFCGPAQSTALRHHLEENVADNEVAYLLSCFETLYPYLQLIAKKNKIDDVFDEKVVEAYWLGNRLLKPLTAFEYQAFAQEKLFLDKKINRESFNKILTKISRFSFFPHHAFHVFNIFKRTGHDLSFHTIETMDQCRISWGKIKKIIFNKKNQENELLVETKILIIKDKGLALSDQPVIKKIKLFLSGKKMLNQLKVNDWISFHWGYFCDRLTDNQLNNLVFFTKKAIDFYNYG